MYTKKPIAAIVLIVTGLVFLAKNFGWLPPGNFLNQWWPAILVIVGVVLLVTGRNKISRQ